MLWGKNVILMFVVFMFHNPNGSLEAIFACWLKKRSVQNYWLFSKKKKLHHFAEFILDLVHWQKNGYWSQLLSDISQTSSHEIFHTAENEDKWIFMQSFDFSVLKNIWEMLSHYVLVI